jgi:hypothetical protein
MGVWIHRRRSWHGQGELPRGEPWTDSKSSESPVRIEIGIKPHDDHRFWTLGVNFFALGLPLQRYSFLMNIVRTVYGAIFLTLLTVDHSSHIRGSHTASGVVTVSCPELRARATRLRCAALIGREG